MKKKNQTIGCFYNNYINYYELKDGEDMVYIEEEIYQKECLKPLFDNDDEFYDGLIDLFDILGVDELRIKKDKDGYFEVILTSEYLYQEYRSKNSPTVSANEILIKAYIFCFNEMIEQGNIQMISVIEGIGDMVDRMKEDGLDKYTIYLKPNNNRDDYLTCSCFDLMNDKKLIKTKKEWKQMYKEYCELKNKYNFKEIIFDIEKFKVTFKF